MTVVVLTNCPPRLRGDLTKWMIEINTNVYVGRFSARVRDELWERICENLKNGQATMVFSTAGEQKMDFRVHNTTWEPVDFDGIKLMLHPSPAHLAGKTSPEAGQGGGKTFRRRPARARTPAVGNDALAVLDIETTGLSYMDDHILELGALLIQDGTPTETFHALICQNGPIPETIRKLTGITDDMVKCEGISLRDGLLRLKDFLGDRTLICQNGSFDMLFLQYACQKHRVPPIRNPYQDTRMMARRLLRGVPNDKLATLAQFFSLGEKQAHRAVKDCELTWVVYSKLKEIERETSQGP